MYLFLKVLLHNAGMYIIYPHICKQIIAYIIKVLFSTAAPQCWNALPGDVIQSISSMYVY